MGIAGAGKSTLARALATRLGCAFQEGDALHPAANIAKMRAGMALDDADRTPWLNAVAAWIAQQRAAVRCGVVSCSALRSSYRTLLRHAGGSPLRFVFLDIPAALAEARLQARSGHFMPAELVRSQLQTLERPQHEADVLTLSAELDLATLCGAAARWLGDRSPADGP